MPAACEKQDARIDAALVAKCNGGDPQARAHAFDALYRRHSARVSVWAHKFTHDEDTAAEVEQETFLYLLRRFPPVGRGLVLQAALDTLLYQTTKHLALTAERNAKRHASCGIDPDDLPAKGAPPPSEIDKWLALLPPRQRTVLWLRFVEDYTLAEIAARLQVPLGTVKSRLRTGLAKLRRCPAVSGVKPMKAMKPTRPRKPRKPMKPMKPTKKSVAKKVILLPASGA